MKKILVPTDFSDCAGAATDVALVIAQHLKAELFFLNICDEPAYVTHVPHASAIHVDYNEHETGHIRNELNQVVHKAEVLGLKATPILVLDNGTEAIENYVEPYHIDLIVMGSHGNKGIREFILGSNTLKLIKHVHVPVLVVKQPLGSGTFKNILFASTFQKEISNSFRVVAFLAHAFKAKLHLVFINFIDQMVSYEEAHIKMTSAVKDFPGLDCTFNVAETNDELWSIKQFSKKLNTDLISVTTNDKVGILKILTTRVPEHLIGYESTPVLILKS